MNELTVFENSYFGKIRTCVVDGELWLVAKDVVVSLNYPFSSLAQIGNLIGNVLVEWKGHKRIMTPARKSVGV
jgi:prophage antirepressor-like protein